MNKNKFTEKLKEGVSVQELEDFARKHTTEVFSVLAIIIGAVSSAFDFFTSAGWSIFFAALGAIIAIFFPTPVEKALKRIYIFAFKQDKTTEMIIGGVMLVVGLFVPFLYFGFLGLLAGSSYHYFIRHAQIMKENTPSHGKRNENSEELD